jgi:hypothetical protein
VNDVLDPTKFRETGTVAPDNVINLKTPEQEAAAKRAAAERAARVAAQKNNPPENLVDGVKPVVENSMGNASAPGIKPVMPTPVVEANPSPMSSTTTPTTEATPQGGVFKLNEPTIQEEQQSTTNLTTEQPQQVEKKLGFFKRLFGGGKKKEPQPTDSPATEQPNPPEQQQ